MSSQLPPIPFGMKINPELSEYLTALRRELEDELDVRPERLEGVVYVGLGNPYVYIADDGSQHELVHEGQIADVVRDADILDVLRDGDRASQSGTLAEVNQNNLFAGTQSVANPVLLDGEVWTAPTLQNGWSNYGSGYAGARFRKLPSGLVLVQGLIKDGTVGSSTSAFTLPVGYRPDGRLIFNPRTSAASANDRLDINTDGSVIVHTGGTTWFSINCQFFAEQ